MTVMLPRVIDARYTTGYRVWLRFAGGPAGEIDLTELLWGPVFEPLKDQAEFAKVRIDPEWHTLVWPNGADLSPVSLLQRLQAALAAEHAAE